MPLSIKAKCFNGQSYDLSLDAPAPSVADLQATISNASGITPDRQTILFKGQVLDPSSPLTNYALSDGSIISVVRRIGKPTSTPATKSEDSTVSPTPPATTVSSDKDKSIGGDDPDSAAPQPPSLEEMMRSLNMGATAGAAPGAVPPAMPDLASLLGGAAGPGAPAAGTPASMEQMFAQLPQMMNGLLKTPLLQDYLNNSDKQEQSREAILSNPLLKGMLESDPEFAKVVNDPEKWRASMEAAKSLFNSDAAAGDAAGAESGMGGTAAAAAAARGLDMKGKGMTATAGRQSAADLAPPGIDIAKLSESYGHALGQSLINSGLGLDPDLVMKGLKSAVDGKKFPMGLPDYERCMATLQNIASEFLTKANLDDANNFFEEIANDDNTIMLEEGKVAYDKAEVEPDSSAAIVEEKATVLVIVSARLLDGRHFFTCPAADDSGDSVHPLTLPLETAPPALAKGIIGMRENESRLLYVHPTACDGMAEMFGDLLPPNALLIFDIQVVSANAPDEEATGEAV